MKFASFLEGKLVCGEMSISGLGKELSVSRQMIYRWLTGEASPTPKTLMRIKDTIELEPGEVGEMIGAWLNDQGLNEIIKLYIHEQLIKQLNWSILITPVVGLHKATGPYILVKKITPILLASNYWSIYVQ